MKNSSTICKKCKHDMKRSRVKFIRSTKTRIYGEVRCNKCKTVYTVVLKY